MKEEILKDTTWEYVVYDLTVEQVCEFLKAIQKYGAVYGNDISFTIEPLENENSDEYNEICDYTKYSIKFEGTSFRDYIRPKQADEFKEAYDDKCIRYHGRLEDLAKILKELES